LKEKEEARIQPPSLTADDEAMAVKKPRRAKEDSRQNQKNGVLG